MDVLSQKKELIGTVVEVKLLATNSTLFDLCFSEFERIEKTYSRFIDNSELSKLNKILGEWQVASEEMIWLISKAIEFKEKTEGNFDITVKSILDNLGYDKSYSFKKKDERKQEISHEKEIEIMEKERKIKLNKEIDFGGFGKGFALDRVKELLERNKINHYYINAGGDIFARSDKNQEPWAILLEHPEDSSRAIGKIELNNMSLAGSAPNRRRWGKYHHLINMKTREPAKGVKAIFVIAKTGIEADTYSTALFTAGFEDGILLSRKLPVEVLIVSDTNRMYQSSGFDAEIFW